MSDTEKRRKEADEKLEEAIKEYMEANDHGEGLLVDWLLITAQHFDEGDGSTATANAIYGPPHQRMYHALGLLDYATIKIRRSV